MTLPYKLLAFALALAGLVTGALWLDQSRQQIGYDRAQTEYTIAASEAQSEYENEARREVDRIRVNEQALADKNQRITNAYFKEKALRVAAGERAADSLRRLESTLDRQAGESRAGQETEASGGTDGARDTVIRECARTTQSLGLDIARVKDKVTGLQAYVSDVCEP